MLATRWGEPHLPVVLCVHGLTRNRLDFKPLAERLSEKYCVHSIDMPGRGGSAWLADKNDYVFPTYVAVLLAWFKHLGEPRHVWIGTSMGGLLGMVMHAALKTKMRAFLINDIGPTIEPASIKRLQTYVGSKMQFTSLDECEAYLRMVAAAFGLKNDAEWRYLAEISSVANEAGVRLHYDPGLAVPFRSTPTGGVDLWPLWQGIACPTLIVRGAESDLLSRDTVDKMKQVQAQAQSVEIAGVGHAPCFFDADQQQVVVDWLQSLHP
ncbi:MAG: hypothetical protein RLZZ502_443 [Pseudomonadota bacterium]